jgi:hypothetical protein
VTGDTVYGGDRRLRIWLEQHAICHVMAVKCTEPVWTLTDRGPGQVAAQDLIARVPAEQWLRLNAGDGSKGKRLYDWTRVPLWRWGWPTNVGFWLLAAATSATLPGREGRRWRRLCLDHRDAHLAPEILEPGRGQKLRNPAPVPVPAGGTGGGCWPHRRHRCVPVEGGVRSHLGPVRHGRSRT